MIKSKQGKQLKHMVHSKYSVHPEKETLTKLKNKKVGVLTIDSKTIPMFDIPSRASIIKELEENSESRLIINELLEITDLPIKTLSEVFEMTPKTFSSYKTPGKHLPIRIVELGIKLRQLYNKGIEIFGNTDNFNSWLMKEAYGLGNTKPLTLINSSTGIDLIYEELIKIEFGATA
jgi:uncharacterized protein (DUF2384 family)